MPRALLVYALILPLAVLLGYMMATPQDTSSFGLVMLVFGVLLTPILLKYHHFLLALTWNTGLIVFFLPGQPPLAMILALVSLTIAIIDRTMTRNKHFLWVPSVVWPLVLLLVVVTITAELTGGIGGRVFGSETWGAKRYFGVFGAVVGFFALIGQPIPRNRALLYVSIYFLGGMTSIVSDLIYMGGPQFYFLFVLFPSDYAGLQAITADTLMRLGGLAFASAAGSYFVLSRYGIQGLFTPRGIGALLLLILFTIGAALGGYRGLLILILLVVISQFIVEGVWRTKLGPILIFGSMLAFGATVAYIDQMPLSIQRALSFLPIERIAPTARMDALSTLDWRLSMWKVLVPEIPKYLLVGKGYSFSGTDYYLTQEAVRRGTFQAYEDILVSGNYHNGILTLLIPFGVFGFMAFLWFCGATLRVLYNNLRYGDPGLLKANQFLLAYVIARLVFYFVFYGQFDLDLMHFTGALGLSIAMNGGKLTKAAVEQTEELEEQPAFEAVPRAVAF